MSYFTHDVINVWCGQCPFWHTVWSMSGVINVCVINVVQSPFWIASLGAFFEHLLSILHITVNWLYAPNTKHGVMLNHGNLCCLTEQAWKSVTSKIFSKTTGKLKETPIKQLRRVTPRLKKTLFHDSSCPHFNFIKCAQIPPKLVQNILQFWQTIFWSHTLGELSEKYHIQ